MKMTKRKTHLSKETLLVDKKRVSYTIRRSRKSRHIRLAITPYGIITLALPWQVSVETGRQFMTDKIAWLKKIISQTKIPRPRKKLLSGLLLPCLGKTYTLIVHIKSDRKRASLVADNTTITITCMAQPQVRPCLEKWYRQAMQIYSGEKATVFSNQLNTGQAKVRAMQATTRWGSCSLKTRTIAINWRLALAPLPILDYVIAHEVAHLRHQNHSKKFWDTVALLYPNHKHARHWLKTHGATLLL